MVSKKEKHLENAQRFVLKGQIDRAIREYQQVVALEPGENRYRQRLAELLVRDGRKEEAIEQYEDIGRHYADNSYFLKAIAVYKQILRLDPTNTRILLTLATLSHKQGLTGSALAEYGQVVAALEKEGNPKRAVEVLEQMISLDGGNLSIRLKHADLLRALGESDRSHQAYSDILGTLAARGDTANAASFARRMALVFPEKDEITLEKVRLLASRGDLTGAVALLEQLLKRDSGSLELWQHLADLERQMKHWPGVKRAATEMARLFPNDAAVVGAALGLTFEAGGAAEGLAFMEQHLARFLEAGERSAAQSLLESVPLAYATHPAVEQGRQRLSAAAQYPGGPINPPPEEELPLELGLEELDELDEPLEEPLWAPQASSAPPVTLPLPAPSVAAEAAWEVEIELDLDDDAPMEESEDLLHLTTVAPDQLDGLSQLDAGEGEGVKAAEQAEVLPLEEALHWLDEEEELVLSLDDDEPSAEQGAAFPEDAEVAGLKPWSQPATPTAPAMAAPTASEMAAPQILSPKGGAWEELFPEYRASQGEVDLEELESHYDLGIAYKEMGLYREAISELHAAAANPRRRLDALTLQAVCYRDLGEAARSEELLRKGCALQGLTPEQRMALGYELASVCEQAGKLEEAQQLYREVYALNPEFHDVALKIESLLEEPLEIIELELEEEEL